MSVSVGLTQHNLEVSERSKNVYERGFKKVFFPLFDETLANSLLYAKRFMCKEVKLREYA